MHVTEKEKDCSACDVGEKGGYAARAREGKRSTGTMEGAHDDPRD